MAATAVITAVCAVVGAGVGIYNAVTNSNNQKKSIDIQQESLDLQKEAAESEKDSYYWKQIDQVRGYDKEITGLQGQIEEKQDLITKYTSDLGKYDRWLDNYGAMYATEMQKVNAQMASAQASMGIAENNAANQSAQYDRWLANYSDMYAQQVQSKQAQTDALIASGKETYENFLNAIGYADAAAGARGTVGAGTSSQQVTKMLDRKLVDYVGEDRTLDEHGGLFGSQLTAANMEMQQLKAGLERQRLDVLGNQKTLWDNLELSRWAFGEQMSALQMGKSQLEISLKQNYDDAMEAKTVLEKSVTDLGESITSLEGSKTEAERIRDMAKGDLTDWAGKNDYKNPFENVLPDFV